MNLGKPVSVVETDRLLLRPFTQADFPALYAYQSRADVTRYLLWDARTDDQVREALGKKIAATTIVSEGGFLALTAATAILVATSLVGLSRRDIAK